ncbi:MAG TPA: ferritin-like domain-containing protein, partial [Lamprocystis sp. (in: g-proteobacteria)]|nr:ferritin-like domain-containing protein [Lamprocystis sp. (in: g-proteobacteria)]
TRGPETQVPLDWVTLQRPLPPKPQGMGWRDYLIMLLHIGAELEHSLMVQYLYAAYSLNDQTGAPEQRRQVGEWRNRLLTIAKEEMGHLLTVQNLLCLVGGPVCFERSHFPANTDFLPFPFRLAPVSAKLLAWYVYAEAPHDWQLLFRDQGQDPGVTLREDIRMVAECVGDTPVTGHAHTVGQLYDRIIEVLADPSRIPDSALRPDTYAHQASWDEWGRGYRPPPARPGETEPPAVPIAERSHVIVLRLATRTEALAALRQIGKQGEAAHLRAPNDQEPSHFERFLSLLDAFRKAEGERDLVYQAPVNPTTMDAGDRPEGSTRIEQQQSLLWATLFNLRYRALLAYLTHSFRLARLVDAREPNVRGAVMHKVFGEMYNLKALAGILVRRPLRDGVPANAACAAPPFEMPYSMDLPTDEPDCWQQHRDILISSLTICDALLTKEDPLAPALTTDEANYLRALRQLDQRSVAWIELIKGGSLRHGGHST